jgi:importin subunit beta-1
MTLIIQLIQSAGRTSTVLEDAFLVVGAMASGNVFFPNVHIYVCLIMSTALEANFSVYIAAFLQYLYPALKQHEDTQLCMVAVGLIGDICRALGEQSGQYSASFMTVLLENLQSEILNRNVKISILSCFGDIALAIGPAFAPYLETTMGVLRQAGSVEPNPVSIGCIASKQPTN